MRKTERLVAIILLLQARGKMTAERLADIFSVSVRTIYRDMESLSLAHVPVTMDYGPGGGYYLPDDYRIDPSTFTGDEAMALAIGGSIVGGSGLFESSDGLNRALSKLEAVLPDEYRADVRAARERTLFDASSWYNRPSDGPHLDVVRRAVWEARVLRIFYPRADGAMEWREVEPHGLVCKAGIWYLVAYCRTRRDFRTFRVERIQELQVCAETVQPRPGFDLAAYWEEARRRFEELTAPFPLVMRISGTALRRLSDRVRADREPDGTFTVRVVTAGLDEAVSYALALGPDALVLEPEDVRARVAAEAAAIAVQYVTADIL